MQSSYKDKDTTTFLVTDLTSYAKMISLWVFFRFCLNLLYWFYANREIASKVTDDDIYSRRIEIKAKNKTIKMNIIDSNIDKRIRTDKYVHEHHAYEKNNA